MDNRQNSHIYILRTLKEYTFDMGEKAAILRTAKELDPTIQKWAWPYTPGIIRILPSGSFAKDTIVKGNTDIDLLISLPSKIDDTLEDVYYSLSDHLEENGFSVTPQNVSLGLNYKGLKIDLVPAKRQPDSTYDHSIYKRKTDTWSKTNVHKHIEYIKNSGRISEIKALKIWRNLRGIDFPSLYLELSVMKALYGSPKSRLPQNIMKVFEYLSSDFLSARVIDPSNTTNILSDDLDSYEKELIAKSAYESLYATSWIHVIW